MPVLQDLSQLKSLYKERWETFIGNAGVVASFAPNDTTTATWLAARLGDTTRMMQTQSSSTSDSAGHNTGGSEGWSPSGGTSGNSRGESAGRSRSTSSNTSPVKVPLMTAQQLHGLQAGYMVLVMAGLSNAAPVYAPAYFRIEQRLNRARVNPYYTPVPRRVMPRAAAGVSGGGFRPVPGAPRGIGKN